MQLRNLFISLIVTLGLFAIAFFSDNSVKTASAVNNANSSYNMKVLVIKYFPLTSNGQNIDAAVTGDVSQPYSVIRQKTIDITNNLLIYMPKATSYLQYKDSSSSPSLNYQLVDTKEYTQPVPIKARGSLTSYPDYNKIMTDHNICDLVNNQGVNEVWIWAYQGPNNPATGQPYLGIAESKMSGPFGDISNSNRFNEMPVCNKTYTVYTFNYGRGTAEAIHSWGHQIESEIDAVDQNFFRSLFQGPNYPQTLGVNGRCGSIHNPPNARNEYDYVNPTSQKSDCKDWNADTPGPLSDISCSVWGCADLSESNNAQLNYIVWNLQNLPGKNNLKTYQSKKLRNFWDIHGNFDAVMASDKTIFVTGSDVPEPPAPPASPFSYLSDLAYSAITNGWGPVEKDKSNAEKPAGDGKILTLNGKTYTKGLGVHAASEINYDMKGACTTFTSDVGMDDEVGNNGSVIFQVFADGTKLFDSGVMTGATATKAISVSVASKNQLKLVVGTNGDNGSDHADWADAKLICGGSLTPSAVPLPSSTAPSAPPAPPPPIETFSYLSDLAYQAIANGWGPVEKDKSNAEQSSGDGKTLTLNSKTYTKGLGVHADSEVNFDTKGICTNFTAEVGVDDEVGSSGSVIFQVFADGAKLFDSGVMTGNTATQVVNVNTSGKNQLKLIIGSNGNNGSDHADWADAKLTCNGAPPSKEPPPEKKEHPSETSFLSELAYKVLANGWGPAEKNHSNGEQGDTDGATITLNGKTYEKGLGIHVGSEITYDMAGKCSKFTSDVGVDDEVGSSGSIIFQVFADGTKLFDSGVMNGSTETKGVDVNTEGKNQLRLVVNGSGGNGSGHGDWADAKITCTN